MTTQPGTQTSGDAGSPTLAPVIPAVVGPNMVPESDLIAAKKGLEHEKEELVKSHTGIVAGLNSQLGEISNSKSALEARVVTLEEDAKIHQGTADALATANTSLAEKTEHITRLNTTLIDSHSKRLQEKGIPAEKLAGKTLDQLVMIEDALGTIVSTPPGGGYAAGTGNGGAPGPVDKMDQYRKMIADAEEKSGKVPSIASEIKT